MVEAVTGELWVDTEELGPAGRDFATVFARSWKLLRPEQRTTLAGLSVFKGPFQSATAKAVTGASWSALLALRNHSLLQRHPQGGFLMHELVRQYAHHKLLEQPERHKETYEKACVHYQEQMARGKESWEAIERDFETVMSVFSWSCQHDGALLLDALPALYDAILGQGRFARGERWFEQMLVGLQADSPGPDGVALWTTLRGDLLVRQGVFFWYMAQITEAQNRCTAGVDLLRTVEAPSQLGFGLFCLGSIWTNRGRYQEARELLLESAALLREREGEESILLQVLRNLGYVALYTGAFAEGLDYFSEGLAHPYTRTDTLLHASMLGHQGMVQMRIEAYEDARASIQQSLVLQSAQSYPFERAYSLALLALVHACLASFDEAESCLDESLALFSQRPTMLHKWFALDTQTRFCCFREDWALAMSSNEQALEFFGSEDEFPRIVSQLLASRGYIMFHEGKLDEAQHDFLKGVRIACGSNQIEPLLENLVGVAACLQANEEQEEALSALCMAQSRAGLYGLFGRWARELRALSGVERETGPESEATGAAEAIFAYGEGLLL
jgi:tetratricopeptide (TPR) repeat protein